MLSQGGGLAEAEFEFKLPHEEEAWLVSFMDGQGTTASGLVHV